MEWKKEINSLEMKKDECQRKRFRAQVEEGESLTKDPAILYNGEHSFGYRKHGMSLKVKGETAALILTCYKKVRLQHQLLIEPNIFL